MPQLPGICRPGFLPLVRPRGDSALFTHEHSNRSSAIALRRFPFSGHKFSPLREVEANPDQISAATCLPILLSQSNLERIQKNGVTLRRF